MNITLIVALASLVAWVVLLFVLHIGAGSVNLLYAIAAIAMARRIIVGNPKFMS
jgi:stage V sporulation protein SpoVS